LENGSTRVARSDYIFGSTLVVARLLEKFEAYRDKLIIFVTISTKIYRTWWEEVNWR
jgi:hypothetical protein